MTEQMRAREEAEKRIARIARQQDHLQRALREAEAPLIEAAFAARAVENDARAAEEAAEWARQHRAAWEVDLAEQARLARTQEDAAAFAAALSARRADEFAALQKARAKKAAERRAAAALEVGLARRREYVRRCRLELED